MVEIICAVIAGVASIVTAAVGLSVKKSNARAERHAKLRERENMLLLTMVDATMQLSVVSSNALTNGHNNGNVEKAREAARKAAEDYENFMREVMAHEVSW